MLMEHVFQCVDDIYDEVVNHGSDELKRTICDLEKIAGHNTPSVIKKGIMLSMTICFNQVQFQDELFEGLLQENLEYMIRHIPEMKKTIQLRVSLRGLDKEMNRESILPYFITLADLAYAVLAVFQAEGHHLFKIESDHGRFGCEQCDQEMLDDYAANVFLSDLYLEEGHQFSLWYDFGEDYVFDIQVLNIQTQSDLFVLEDSQITSGKGYGIWEDEHELLEMYYKDYDEFLMRIEDYGLDEDDFIFDEFDKDIANEMLMEDFEFLRHVYEDQDEDLW